jgi:membrane-bound lytic murein transglycosylase D
MDARAIRACPTRGVVRAAGLVLLFSALMASACSSARVVSPEPVEPPPPEPLVEEVPREPAGPTADELYARLPDIRLQYRASIDLILSGEEVLGERKFADASNELRETVDACATTLGCDLAPFLAVQEQLLSEQSIALKRQSAEIAALESAALEAAAAAEEAEREPGTTSAAVVQDGARSVPLLRGNDLRNIIELSGPVNAALNDWLTWMRPLLMESYLNYQYLREDMAPVYDEAGLPEALLFAMMATETGGRVHSVSRSGAAGPLQFMSRTGRKYGLRKTDGFDMRFDPTASTRANVAYLEERFAALNDDLEMALAAYNGGEYRVERLHRRLPGKRFWDSEFFYALPRETREYVPRVLAAAWLFLHPEDYNLQFPAVDPTRSPLTVREAISLSELAICFGQEQNRYGWFRTLRNLNPRLEPGDRIEAGEELVVPAAIVPFYEERCLGGRLLETARVLHDADYPEEPEVIPYVVRRGDTLARIARNHRCVSMQELAAINNIRPPRYLIRVGQRLKIPGCS